MAYDRYPPNTDPEHDFYNRHDPQDYGHDYGAGTDYTYSSAREYAAEGLYDEGDRGRGRGRYGGRYAYGRRDDLGPRERYGASYPQRDYYGGRRYGRDDMASPYEGSYGSTGNRFLHSDRMRDRPRYARRPEGYSYEDRGFFQRAGDEVMSWFGDDDAERRRELDQRYDERHGDLSDAHYHNWRRDRIAELDSDYAEYRRENAQQFHNEFSNFRTERQTQRSSLSRVSEHMEVVGSDGEHVGTVDKVRGDRIILTKSDPDAGGHHHSIPSRWIEAVDDKVTIRKTADDAHNHWRDEERNRAFFEDNADERAGDHKLNRSFAGTY